MFNVVYRTVSRREMSSLFSFGFTSNFKSAKSNEKCTEKSSESAKKCELKRKRNFLPQWKSEFEWLRYDESLGAMFNNQILAQIYI